MTIKAIVAAVALTLLLGNPGSAQSAADLLQKGIYAQETTGDLDTAIQIFRQVAGAAANNRALAAQAQYQLVLCMLQKGDRAAAARELETLVQKFPDQQDLITKGRKLLPGNATPLPAPWAEGECAQFNLRRDGVATGETLYYSVDTGEVFVPSMSQVKSLTLRWELNTQKSSRNVQMKIDRNTLEPLGRPLLNSTDEIGDPSVEPIAGPAVDVQQSVFAMRRLPLAVGYKTTLMSLPFTLTHLAPSKLEIAVSAIEAVDVTAGTFKCYKLSIAPLGQTFWIGVEGARPLVKFKTGNVEAEMAHFWGPGNFIEAELGFLAGAGWRFDDWLKAGPGPVWSWAAREDDPAGGPHLNIRAKKVLTPASDIAGALQQEMADVRNGKVRPESIQTRIIGGQQALSCIADDGKITSYYVWIRSETAAIQLDSSNQGNIATTRWIIDRALATAKRIP